MIEIEPEKEIFKYWEKLIGKYIFSVRKPYEGSWENEKENYEYGSLFLIKEVILNKDYHTTIIYDDTNKQTFEKIRRNRIRVSQMNNEYKIHLYCFNTLEEVKEFMVGVNL